MGMYNIVKLDQAERCPNCGHAIDEWQSKLMTYAGYDLANVLRKLELNSRMDGEIHSFCNNCRTFIEFEIKKGKLIRPGKLSRPTE